MYSGTTLTWASGRLVGAHQKIDKLARRHLDRLFEPEVRFPAIRTILHFEGRNGPDGIKTKSPAKDEPWHYVSPFDDEDKLLGQLIDDHYHNLVKALVGDDLVVAGFEAAWLAHAVVDGLTPAHHFPYEEKLVELRGGQPIANRTTYKEKVLMHGGNRRETLLNNWKMWGPKGLFSTHIAFEWGVSSILLPMRSSVRMAPDNKELRHVQQTTASEYFGLVAKEVAAYGLYDAFYKHGWTARLARTVRQQLVPTIIKSVTLLWYKAALEASQTARETL